MGEHHFGNFTLGIIDLLMNNTGEFVTERSWGALGHMEAFLPVSLHLRQTGSFWALHVSKMPQGGTACLILVFSSLVC